MKSVPFPIPMMLSVLFLYFVLQMQVIWALWRIKEVEHELAHTKFIPGPQGMQGAGCSHETPEAVQPSVSVPHQDAWADYMRFMTYNMKEKK